MPPGRADPSASSPAQPRPARPRRNNVRRPAPTCPWHVRVLFGLNKISFCSCLRKVIQDIVYDAPMGERDGCPLGKLNRRRPVLPSPAPTLCSAVRRSAPTRPWYVRVLDLTNLSNPAGRGARRTAGRGRPADGGRRGGVGVGVGQGANRIDRPGDKGPSYPPGHRRHVA